MNKTPSFFKNCVGVIDGTHFRLSTRPDSYGEEYFTKKGQCAMSALIIVVQTYWITFTIDFPFLTLIQMSRRQGN